MEETVWKHYWAASAHRTGEKAQHPDRRYLDSVLLCYVTMSMSVNLFKPQFLHLYKQG